VQVAENHSPGAANGNRYGMKFVIAASAAATSETLPGMTEISLIFPHQLYADSPALAPGRPVCLVEDALFFRQYRFHKKKLVFHRASMKHYALRLQSQGYVLTYVASGSAADETKSLFETLAGKGVRCVHLCEPDDYLLRRRLIRYSQINGVHLRWYENPGFMVNAATGSDWLASHRMHQTDWYVHFRKAFGILTEAAGRPAGGKWTYDTENRKPLPAGIRIPALSTIADDEVLEAAIGWVNYHFPENPGETSNWEYPCTHARAESWLQEFLEQRFRLFGTYQDALVPGQSFLFHSVLSMLLNSGLLLPETVIQRALEAADEFEVPLYSLEGFIRQVLGWREYVRAVYHFDGVGQRTGNYFEHTLPVPEAMYQGTSQLLPIDESLGRLWKTAYSHHIERLMLFGNFMLLTGMEPNAVYRWFMEAYIDAYDWVMVPNVYGMSQFADGGRMCTKPYISGSAYLLRMGHYTKGSWCAAWDALYWTFIATHASKLKHNPRMAIPLAGLNRIAPKLPAMFQLKTTLIHRLWNTE
jgi:deoxyribodipyrimidine photolyase-related protein